MLIRERRSDERTTRELKVIIPADLRIRLHETKIRHGERICDVVTRALDAYFSEPDGDAT